MTRLQFLRIPDEKLADFLFSHGVTAENLPPAFKEAVETHSKEVDAVRSEIRRLEHQAWVTGETRRDLNKKLAKVSTKQRKLILDGFAELLEKKGVIK